MCDHTDLRVYIDLICLYFRKGISHRRLPTRASVKLASDRIQTLALMLGILNTGNPGIENLVHGWCITYLRVLVIRS